jgi:DNA-binding NarL/FixJ family response regulator
VPPQVLRQLLADEPGLDRRPPQLTQREQDVLAMLEVGTDTRTIARELGITVNTCRGYVKTLLAKLDAHSQLEAVAVARSYGLFDVGSDR